MKRLHAPAAVSALALSLVFAAPAMAQQAPTPAQPAPQAAAGATGPAAAATPGQREVSGRELMTPQERRSFRDQMRAATPEQRQLLWAQKRTELEQRATQRGLVLAEAGPRWGGRDGKGGRNAAEGNHGEGRGSMLILMTRQPPRAP